MSSDQHVVAAGVVLFGVLVLCMLDRVYRRDRSGPYVLEYDKKVRSLCAQSIEWMKTADQDAEPSIATLHYANAAAYLHSALELADAARVSEHVGADAAILIERIKKRQMKRFREIFASCPDSEPTFDLPLTAWR